MSANTRLLIKRSDITSTPNPNDLKKGELGYSYASNTLFIGTSDDGGTGARAVGGEGLLSALSSNLTISDAASNTQNVNLSTDSLNFRGTGIVSANVITDMFGEAEVVISLNDTAYIRANVGATNTTQIVSTRLQIDGDLIVNGTTTTINSTTVETGDTILVLANNNTSGDSVDFGFVAKYNDGTSNLVSGLVRDSSSQRYALFDNQDLSTFSGISTSSMENDVGTSGQPQFAYLYANVIAPQITVTEFLLQNDKINLGGNPNQVYGRGIAIGQYASANTGETGPTGVDAIAIGYATNDGGNGLAGESSIAIGTNANASNTFSIAIGNEAEANHYDGTDGTIVLNSSFMGLAPANTGFYVNPVRYIDHADFDEYEGFVTYNTQTKEMRRTQWIDGGSF
jgi:hypothetical protein